MRAAKVVLAGLALVAASCSAAVGGAPASPVATGSVRATSSTAATSTAATSTTATPATGSPGCGRTPDPGPTAGVGPTADVARSLPVAGTVRTYRLAVPTGYQASRPAPLVLLFHGFASRADEFSAYTGLPAAGVARGYLVATPDAVKGSWTVSAPDAHTADLQFVAELLQTLSARYCVDPTRVYAAGFSLGSEFAAISACAFPGRFAAAALASAEFLLRPCPRPVSVIAFHGTADPLVAYPEGGVGLSLPGKVRGVENNLSDWAALAGCRVGADLDWLAPSLLRRTWAGCPAGLDVVLYTAIAGGHAWPAYATSRVLDFFDRHRLVGGA